MSTEQESAQSRAVPEQESAPSPAVPEQETVPSPAVPDEQEISLLDALIVLAKYGKMIVLLVIVGTVSAVAYSYQLPDIYTAKARIMPPQGAGGQNAAALAQLAIGIVAPKGPTDNYLALLKSRTIRERLVQRLGLQAVYGHQTPNGTVNMLEDASDFRANKEGLLSVEVSDEDPKRAAMLANAYIAELEELVHTTAITDASMRRAFFEREMRVAKDKLTAAEQIFDRTPNTSLKYLEAVRNLKFQEAIYELLAKQFTMAKLDEAKDFPFVQALDKAIPPETKSRPKRVQIGIVATLISGFFGVLIAFLREAHARAKSDPKQAERLKALRRHLFR